MSCRTAMTIELDVVSIPAMNKSTNELTIAIFPCFRLKQESESFWAKCSNSIKSRKSLTFVGSRVLSWSSIWGEIRLTIESTASLVNLNPESESSIGHLVIALGSTNAKGEEPLSETVLTKFETRMTIFFRFGSSISYFSPVMMDHKALMTEMLIVPIRSIGFPVWKKCFLKWFFLFEM